MEKLSGGCLQISLNSLNTGVLPLMENNLCLYIYLIPVTWRHDAGEAAETVQS